MAHKKAAPAKVEPITVTNHRKGTTLSLGDGRTLEFGESAVVSAEVKAACIATGSGQ